MLEKILGLNRTKYKDIGQNIKINRKNAEKFEKLARILYTLF
ncbi:hypothetical protein DEHRE_13430 [Dehalobacter restrictus DSM 9455]|uniref:Uncharacterized protein n=1 Tax=Dehalobacter restrictus (strain DSM 9455 / PER-K23) TaxID=871738 RepID=A0ABM5PAH0_DEHRP|nr:hypothetical protein DEHRE_13430 [Dehalobacter restrictus DSM 9455]